MPEPKPVPEPSAVKAKANGAVVANGETANGSSLLNRFGMREEPQEVPDASQTRVVRQQPFQQTGIKHGNTGNGRVFGKRGQAYPELRDTHQCRYSVAFYVIWVMDA
jgi:hypothetical protein